jgi:hypothetical protein
MLVVTVYGVFITVTLGFLRLGDGDLSVVDCVAAMEAPCPLSAYELPVVGGYIVTRDGTRTILPDIFLLEDQPDVWVKWNQRCGSHA